MSTVRIRRKSKSLKYRTFSQASMESMDQKYYTFDEQPSDSLNQISKEFNTPFSPQAPKAKRDERKVSPKTSKFSSNRQSLQNRQSLENRQSLNSNYRTLSQSSYEKIDKMYYTFDVAPSEALKQMKKELQTSLSPKAPKKKKKERKVSPRILSRKSTQRLKKEILNNLTLIMREKTLKSVKKQNKKARDLLSQNDDKIDNLRWEIDRTAELNDHKRSYAAYRRSLSNRRETKNLSM